MALVTRQNILITGASSGLGEGMARLFATQGRNLVLCARRVDRLEVLAAELTAATPGITVLVRELDVTDYDAVFRVFNEADEAIGGLDRIIANAGIGKGKSLGKGRFDANRATLETNVIGLLAQCEAALALFRPRNAGHLVVMSSVLSLRGAAGSMTAYAASKAAASSLAEGMRLDLLGSPIQVTTLMPGYIESEMTAPLGKVPMLTPAAKGHEALVSAIESETDSAYIPRWPWTGFAQAVKAAPLPLLKKMM